ncbi:MAG: hypothetical protein KDA21_08200, partial [Phycisphaerales bacterium]|nr:hypothetical protein [Phycisphaerales bacterium]
DAAPTPAKSEPGRNWARDADRFTRRLGEERLNALTRDLGVTAAALRRIQVGWNGKSYTFPERDGAGAVIGIATRDMTGKKRTAKGSRRGLVIPLGFAELPDPVVVAEGPTDVAALLTMGITAVGRPSARAGCTALSEALKDRTVIFMGENDRKADGRWPGREGAEAVACKLSEVWKQPVTWALPPEGAKDVRDFLVQARTRGNADLIDVGLELLRRVDRNIIEPATNDSPSTGKSRRSLAAQLVELVRARHELCMTPGGRPYLIRTGPHGQARALEVGSEGLDLLLTTLAWSELEQAPSGECLRDVARCSPPRHSRHRRGGSGTVSPVTTASSTSTSATKAVT